MVRLAFFSRIGKQIRSQAWDVGALGDPRSVKRQYPALYHMEKAIFNNVKVIQDIRGRFHPCRKREKRALSERGGSSFGWLFLLYTVPKRGC